MKLGNLLFVAALAAVVSPLAAQQPTAQQLTVQQPTSQTVAAPVEQVVTAPVVAPTTPPPGPRVRAEFRPAESSIRDSRAAAFQEGDHHTITISTLALVLGVVILVLLVAR